MAIDLKGKPIAITGASSGIGAATAVLCARAGMPVAISARRADKLDEVARRIRGEGGRVVAVPGDVANADDCERLYRAAEAEFGSVYAVFANAGYGLEMPVHEMSDEQIRAMFETNFFGSLNIIRPLLRRLGSRPGETIGAGSKHPTAHVLLCSSCLSRMSVPYYSVYSATKAAQSHLGRAMDHELARFGVRVSTVHPIGTKTEFFDQVKTRSGTARLVEHSREMFMQTPDRVARAIVKCLRKPRPEVWTSVLTRWGMAVCAAFPGIEDRFLRRMVTVRTKNQSHGR